MPAMAGRPFSTMASLLPELAMSERLGSVPIAAKALVARTLYGISLKHFFSLRVYERPVGDWPDYMSYFGELEPGLRTLNWRGDGKAITVDKLGTAEHLTKCGIRNAPLLACIGRDRKAHPFRTRFPAPSSPAEIEPLLAGCADDLFVKPAMGWRGKGVFRLDRAPDGWIVEDRLLTDGEAATLLLERAPPPGLLVQRRLRSHPDLAPIGGDFALSTVRINTALTEAGPRVLFAYAKLVGRPSLTDNFTGGRSGNMIGELDLASGMLGRVLGRRPGRRHVVEEIDRHPATGAAFAGFRLPLWHDAVTLALETSAACAVAPLIGIDLAITAEGPMIVELQSDWGCSAAQLMLGGLRPMLRKVVPTLAADSNARQLAFEQMRLGDGRGRRTAVPLQRLARAARI